MVARWSEGGEEGHNRKLRRRRSFHMIAKSDPAERKGGKERKKKGATTGPQQTNKS